MSTNEVPNPPPYYEAFAKPVYPGAQLAYSAATEKAESGVPTVVSSPALPYLGMIPNGMKIGKLIVVKLIVKPNPKRFHVNFQCGMCSNPRSDVALHFNPRFKDKTIVLNTLRNTRWDWREQRPKIGFPLVPNGTYEIMFLCEKDKFNVAMNGLHLFEYKHRLPFQNISALEIAGDCDVIEVQYN
ncbi:galectin-4-like [Patiria miniata]|uniref:Galectin n=1 Tax=Patiria miniata TaxID=46514 RepID=A0A914B1R5_PATMI|nr:galectin-4-like [Patiria miniata]XP_038069740.1 galectin-4-like [Patiria miniata]XP_038069741.1 galectin-4-like [Patiria miniata]